MEEIFAAFCKIADHVSKGDTVDETLASTVEFATVVCIVIAALFASSMLHFSIRMIVIGLFITAMLASIVSLSFFLREVYFAIETFEIGLPAGAREGSSECRGDVAEGEPA